MNILQRVCQLLLVLLVITGCSKRYDELPPYLPFSVAEYSNKSVGRFKTSYLVEQIDEYYRGVNPGPLGVTSFVNLDDLNNSSSFGRMVSEQVMSELAMRGFDVVELRHADALQIMEEGGEFALSREVNSVRREQKLGGIIVGTYVVSPVRVYVNARLLDPTNSMILSAGSVEMDKTSEIARLLRGGGMLPTLERIPVRQLGFQTFPAFMPVPKGYDAAESGFQAAPAPVAVQPKLPQVGKVK